MSDFQTYRLANGGFADVPNDKAEEWARRMESRGIKFEPADVQANMEVGDPEVIKTPQQHGASGDWGDDQDMGFMDRFASGAKQYGQDFAKAGSGFVRGLNQSLYQGGSDEFAAGARALGGENFGSALKDEQAQRDQAWNDTPITYGAGRALGYVPGMMMGGPVGQGVKGALARFGSGIAQAGVNGFLSDDGDVESRMETGGKDAMMAAPFSAAGELASAVAPGMDRGGIALRRANAGGSAGEMNAIRQSKGIDQMQNGIDQDFSDLGLASSLLPQSAYGVAKKLGTPESPGMLQSAGQQMGGQVDAAGEAGIRGSWDSVRGLMDNSARAELGRSPAPTAGSRSFADELGRISRDELPQPGAIQMNQDPSLELGPAGRTQHIPGLNYEDPPQLDPATMGDSSVVNRANAQRARLGETYTQPTPDAAPRGNLGDPVRIQSRPTMQPDEDPFAPIKNSADEATPRELQNQKVAFEKQGYPRAGTVRLESDSPRAEAYQAAAGASRDELHDVMSGTDFYPGFNQGRETIEKGTPIAEMAGNRAAANKAGSGFMNPVALGAGIGGAGAGFMGGGIPGAIAGGAMGFGANALARNYGQDVAGMGMRAASAGVQGMGNVLQTGARGAGGMASMMGANEPQTQDNSNGLAENVRGYMTPQVVGQLLQQNPMAFGKYTKDFQQAQQSQDPGEMVKLLDRLETTDDEWRQQYLPQILQMTAQGSGM